MLPDFVQRFESKRQVVEAVQLTADADWEAIAAWCGGEVSEDVDEGRIMSVGIDEACEGDWIILVDEDFEVRWDSDVGNLYEPVPDLEGVVGEIRQALEDTTPGPWEWCEDGESMWLENSDGTDVVRADQYEWLHMTQADGELIAAAPDLLARAAARIEQLERELALARAAWSDLAFPKPGRRAKEGA